jgi:phosphatidylinositol dimannoside acyltransferase
VSLRARLWLFRIIGGVLERLPERFDVGLGESIAGAIGRRRSWATSPLRDNVARALGGDDGEAPDEGVVTRYLVRSMRSYGRYWSEGAKLPTIPKATVTQRLRICEGEDHLRAAVERGNGVVLALPHIGSWEWGGAFLFDVGWPMTAVAERLEPPELFEWFLRKRVEMGIEIVALEDGAGATTMRALREGKVLGLLCERDLQDNGLPVELFGAPTTVPAGPATLALRTGAALLCAAVYSGPGRDHHVVVTPEIDTTRQGPLRKDVARVTQQVIDELGWLIRRAPEQWHVLQPIWRGSPE